jgi:phosphate transport system protein
MLPTYELKKSAIIDDIVKIGEATLNALEQSYDAIKSDEISALSKIKLSVKKIEDKANGIDNDVIKLLALYSPEAKDLRELISYLKITNDLARASYNIKTFCKLFKKSFSDDLDTKIILEYTLPLHKSAHLALKTALSMINDENEESVQNKYHKVFIEVSKTDDFYSMIEKNILKLMTKNHELAKEYFEVLTAIRKLDKITDRAQSLASLSKFAEIGGELEH